MEHFTHAAAHAAGVRVGLIRHLVLGISLLACTPADSGVQADSAPAAVTFQQAANACSTDMWCFRDTTMVRFVDHDPGTVVSAQWLLFAQKGDSIDVTARADSMRQAIVSMHPGSAAGGRRAFRVAENGVVRVVINTDEDAGDSIPIIVRISPIRPGTIRGVATLSLSAPEGRFRVWPASTVSPVLERWTTFAGRFKVPLLDDSLFVVCRDDCATLDTVVLKPGSEVTVRD